MSQHRKTSLCRITFSLCSMLLLTNCGVLFPEQADPIVLTKVEMRERAITLDATCPPKPVPPQKPPSHNVLSKDAAEYFAALDGWAMTCRDLNEAIESILRPSKEELKPAVNDAH